MHMARELTFSTSPEHQDSSLLGYIHFQSTGHNKMK